MSEAAAIPKYAPQYAGRAWVLPSRGIIGMVCLITAESAIFLIFIVAYLYYAGKSLTGPTPREVLELPIFTSICLFSSSATVHFATSALHRAAHGATSLWLAATVLLGAIFLGGTAHEWYHLIAYDHLTLQTNLFGTSFYSLVGLHASHVIVGLIMLSLALFFSLKGSLKREYSNRLEVIALYWHFVDAIWVVVFTVVYIVCR